MRYEYRLRIFVDGEIKHEDTFTATPSLAMASTEARLKYWVGACPGADAIAELHAHRPVAEDTCNGCGGEGTAYRTSENTLCTDCDHVE